jgi:hypothetical protein
MSIKRGVVSGLVVATVLVASTGRTQEISTGAWEELRELQGEIPEDRKAIVEENLALTSAEAKAFWPVYEEYRGAREALSDRGVRRALRDDERRQGEGPADGVARHRA